MFSPLEYKMWSNEGKLKPSYPAITSVSDKSTRTIDKRIAKMHRDSLLSMKQIDSSSDNTSTAPPRKARALVSTSISTRASSKPKDRFGLRQPSDVQKGSEADVLVRRKPKKTKNTVKPYPGKIYREKTFGVFSVPVTAELERPTNIPRRRVQDNDEDPLDRGYVSDVKSELSRRNYRENEEEFQVDKRIRPKSAGQALYAADSDDDSSLDGEIEVIDIDNDDTFIVIQDTQPNKHNQSVMEKSTHKPQENGGQANRFHGNSENTNKQDQQPYVNVTEHREGKSHLDNNSSNYTGNSLSPGMFDRRRVKSDSAVIPLKDNFVDKKTDGSHHSSIKKKANSLNNRYRASPAITTNGGASNQDMSANKTYAKAVEKVITKYSAMSVRGGDKDGKTMNTFRPVGRNGESVNTSRPVGRNGESVNSSRPVGRTGEYQSNHGQRASLPRKLKPLLNREKLGHVNQDTTGEIDYSIPFS